MSLPTFHFISHNLQVIELVLLCKYEKLARDDLVCVRHNVPLLEAKGKATVAG